MKKQMLPLALSLALCLTLFSGCGDAASSSSENNVPSSTGSSSMPSMANASSQNADTPNDSANTQTFTFQVNADMPVYQCTAILSDGAQKQTEQIVITDADTGAEIQVITPPSNEVFTKSAVYFMDVTFNGDLALLIPIERAASYVSFTAYVWDAEEQEFAEAPSFQNILNPAIDTAQKRILSKRFGNQMTSYTMHAFDNGEFVRTNSLFWQPADLETDDVSNAENLSHLIEKEGFDPETTKQDFYAARPNPDDLYSIDREDTRIKPYFISGSFWDLESEKWQCTFLTELK